MKHQNAALLLELSRLNALLAEAEKERDILRKAYQQALEQLQLLRRRMFVASAERPVSTADQLAFEGLLAEVERLEGVLDGQDASGAGKPDKGAKGDKGDKPAKQPMPRRELEKTDLEVRRIELLDPALEGKAERIGFDETSRLAYQRATMVRLVVAVATYKRSEPPAEGTPPGPDGKPAPAVATFHRTSFPRELLGRGLLAPSMIAHLLVSKYVMGVPFYRLESQMAFCSVSLDRSTMCRYAENAGATFGAVVDAMKVDALKTAFCLSTDATGVAVQPTRLPDRTRQPCKKGHFFVVLADRDHVFFEYQAKHTSAAVCTMFKGFGGYIQADAHAVYDALFRGAAIDTNDEGATPPTEVGCWSHCRRHFWEAAVCKHRLGIEGLQRIDTLFAADAKLKKLAPAQRHALRQLHVRPLVDSFFAWVQHQLEATTERGLVKAALGYALRQQAALRRFLEDGRLRLENNSSERELRRIAIGRKNWLFVGSDDHAEAAANIFSLIASCKLHGLDPELYLCELIQVMPYWPRDRYIELSPRNWAQTRARLDPAELARELGTITVPPKLTSEEQPLSR